MKKSILYWGMSFVLCSCLEHENKSANRIDSIVSLPIPIDTANENFVKGDSLPKDTMPFLPAIEGTVYYNTSYCGGARPTDEILAEQDKLRLFTKSTLKLKSKSDEFLITTDDKGNFSSKIPFGTYAVWLTKETNPKIHDVGPSTCENCLTQAITSVKIKEGKKVWIQFRFPCDPGAKMRP